jgi:hypothetical protein
MKYFFIMLLLLTSCHKNTLDSCIKDTKERLNIRDRDATALIGIFFLCNSCKNDPDCVMSKITEIVH